MIGPENTEVRWGIGETSKGANSQQAANIKSYESNAQHSEYRQCYRVNIKIAEHPALTGVAQLLGGLPGKREVAGSIPGQGTSLGCTSFLHQGVLERQLIDVSHIDVTFSLSPSLLLSLKINKIFLQIAEKLDLNYFNH